jgi:hypothetical protein
MRKNMVGVIRLHPLLGRVFLIPELVTKDLEMTARIFSRQHVRRDGLFSITRIVIMEPRYCTEERKLGACKSNTYKEDKENGIQ